MNRGREGGWKMRHNLMEPVFLDLLGVENARIRGEAVLAGLTHLRAEKPWLKMEIMRRPTFIKPMSSNLGCQFQITTTELRRHIGTVLDWAGESNERIMITVRGQNAAMLVPLTKAEQDIFLQRKKQTLGSVRRGLAEAAAGRTVYRGSFGAKPSKRKT